MTVSSDGHHAGVGVARRGLSARAATNARKPIPAPSHGNTDLADCFGCEVLRIYDMYRFRFKQKSSKTAPHLTPDDSWTKDYYDPNNLKFADRVVFSGATSNEGASANAHPATTAAHSIQRLRAPKPPARKKAVGA